MYSSRVLYREEPVPCAPEVDVTIFSTKKNAHTSFFQLVYKEQQARHKATYLENSGKRRLIVVREHLVQVGKGGFGRNSHRGHVGAVTPE